MFKWKKKYTQKTENGGKVTYHYHVEKEFNGIYIDEIWEVG